MSHLYPITADTKRHAFLYGPFVIEESIDGWEWAHEDFPAKGFNGICETVFEAIEAADAWLDVQGEAA